MSVPSTIRSILKKNGFSDRMGTWWVAISNLETGKWTSNLFRSYNNLFGMKQPLSRFTYSLGPSPTGYATFATIADSVNDIVAYMNARLYPKDFDSIDDLVAFMKSKGYFEDPDYLNKVKSRL
jgi:flagellum-specific peptidoglycan hydrolase FlgJ